MRCARNTMKTTSKSRRQPAKRPCTRLWWRLSSRRPSVFSQASGRPFVVACGAAARPQVPTATRLRRGTATDQTLPPSSWSREATSRPGRPQARRRTQSTRLTSYPQTRSASRRPPQASWLALPRKNPSPSWTSSTPTGRRKTRRSGQRASWRPT